MNLLPRLPEDILEKTKEPIISQAGLTSPYRASDLEEMRSRVGQSTGLAL